MKPSSLRSSSLRASLRVLSVILLAAGCTTLGVAATPTLGTSPIWTLSQSMAESNVQFGNLAMKQNDVAGAISHYDRAVALWPECILAHYYRGAARQASGDINGAAADFNAVIALTPRDANSFHSHSLTPKASEALASADLGKSDGLLIASSR